MPKKKLQMALDTIHVTNKKLVEALDNIEEFETATAPLREQRADASRPFGLRIKALANEYGVAQSQADAAQQEEIILKRLEKSEALVDGAQIRCGAYVLTVKQTVTMEHVEHGVGWKLGKPLHLDEGEGDDDS